jgi:hypothetical protein
MVFLFGFGFGFVKHNQISSECIYAFVIAILVWVCVVYWLLLGLVGRRCLEFTWVLFWIFWSFDPLKKGSEIYHYLEEKNCCQFFEKLAHSGSFC